MSGLGDTPKQQVILVVDDDEMVRGYVCTVLDAASFTVIEAGDGLAALAVFHKQAESIRAMVLDVTLPKLDGWGVVTRLRAGGGAGATVPILIISGYQESEGPAEMPTDALAFLAKPFRPDELLECLDRLIASG